jgi:hypothetical protein
LKIGLYNGYVDMHLYEETNVGDGDMWQKDAMIYNLNKFKMDKNLLGISDEDLE